MSEATRLLDRLSRGDGTAAEQLLPLVYGELYVLAARSMQGQRRDHTLQPTALVNEAWMRLVGDGVRPWQDRVHFLGVAAKAMRSVLIDHARARLTLKRGGGRRPEELRDVAADVADPSTMLALHEALERLSAIDPALGRLVELRFFGGLGVDEVAAVLGVSARSVKRDWRTARAWLRCDLDGGDDDDS